MSAGSRTLRAADPEQRIPEAFGELTGAAFDFGPIGVGPGRLAKVTAQVELGQPRITIPLHVDLVVDLAVDRSRFQVDGTVHLLDAAWKL
ncbi:hypothetical protein ACWF82_08245 [Nocardia sp. NPDC055053]